MCLLLLRPWTTTPDSTSHLQQSITSEFVKDIVLFPRRTWKSSTEWPHLWAPGLVTSGSAGARDNFRKKKSNNWKISQDGNGDLFAPAPLRTSTGTRESLICITTANLFALSPMNLICRANAFIRLFRSTLKCSNEGQRTRKIIGRKRENQEVDSRWIRKFCNFKSSLFSGFVSGNQDAENAERNHVGPQMDSMHRVDDRRQLSAHMGPNLHALTLSTTVERIERPVTR